ncbi:MAG: 2-C-methyl-D-erythritol 4-phosphate cytidylyltransferase [Pseudomonadota bacterium]
MSAVPQSECESVWAVVPAAGNGTRMSADRPKQYLALNGRSVIEHSINALSQNSLVSGVVVAIARDDKYWTDLDCGQMKILSVVEGGNTRMASVLNALKSLMSFEQVDPGHWVLVHDAARPCLRQSDLTALIENARSSPDGAILATPVVDSIKQQSGEDTVVGRSVNRSGLWRALTPQMFRIRALCDALEACHNRQEDVTDESSAMEQSGYHPVLVEGSSDNIKITTPADLALADFYIGQHQ